VKLYISYTSMRGPLYSIIYFVTQQKHKTEYFATMQICLFEVAYSLWKLFVFTCAYSYPSSVRRCHGTYHLTNICISWGVY